VVKTFKQHVNSSLHPDFEKDATKFADEHYRGVHPDLPRHGNYHFRTAKDHLADTLYDKFGKVGSGHYQRIAHNVVSKYADDDTKESKDNDRKREKAYQKSLNVKPVKQPKVKNWDDHKPFTHARKGTGSY
jgi:hypothetical protein